MRFLRFNDLKEMGLVASWPQLEELVKNHNFPPGRRQGERMRIWSDEEIAAYDSLPPADEKAPPLRGGARINHEATLKGSRGCQPKRGVPKRKHQTARLAAAE
jgi:hypothetical protein